MVLTTKSTNNTTNMKTTLHAKIYDEIIGYLCDRRGFTSWYENIDGDVQDEIESELTEIIKNVESEWSEDAKCWPCLGCKAANFEEAGDKCQAIDYVCSADMDSPFHSENRENSHSEPSETVD